MVQDQNEFDDQMSNVLEGLERNEEARLRCCKAGLRKIVVYEMALYANRSYDALAKANVMENISLDDIKAYVDTKMEKPDELQVLVKPLFLPVTPRPPEKAEVQQVTSLH